MPSQLLLSIKNYYGRNEDKTYWGVWWVESLSYNYDDFGQAGLGVTITDT